MADPVRPLRLGTVIWFGSLEFMSLGYEYDMVLLCGGINPYTLTAKLGLARIDGFSPLAR